MSYFEALEAEIPAVEAHRSMLAAQAAVYPHVRQQDARQMWSRWAETAYRSAHQAATRAGALFTVNGEAVGVSGLKRWMRKVIGRGLAA